MPRLSLSPICAAAFPGERGSHTSVAAIDAVLQLLSPLKKTVYIGEAMEALTGPTTSATPSTSMTWPKRYGAQVVNLSNGPRWSLPSASPSRSRRFASRACSRRAPS